MQKYIIYRSIRADPEANELHKYRLTMRPPVNVPYIVDNLWEWKRPDEYPNRRYSVFASPDERQSLESARGPSVSYRVELIGNFKICQLLENHSLQDSQDSKNHPDCKRLSSLLINELGQSWVDSDVNEKTAAGRLWIPCLTKEAVENLFLSVETLSRIRDNIYDAISYWNDVVVVKADEPLPSKKGEVFFEPFDGYYLRKL